MLAFLLDEHVSPKVAAILRRQQPAITVHSLPHWEDGRFLGLPDMLLLQAAAIRHVTLVTYDRRTIPPLLKAWAEADRHHGGVVFVDEKTIRTFDISGLARALRVLWHEAAKWDWTNRIYFLQS